MSAILHVVATPIGNLGDASVRSLEALRAADMVACEDTRVTRTLLGRFGVKAELVTLQKHNERTATAKLVEQLLSGRSVALVSDAGTPALSDPGALLVEQAHRAGIKVTPIPGPSAVAAALSISGFPAAQFFFAGFLPAGATARRKALGEIDGPWPIVLYEAPHRIRETLADLASAFGAAREVAISRELTKKFEEVVRLPLGAAGRWLDASPHREQGEFVLVLAPGNARIVAPMRDPDEVLEMLLTKLAPSEAAKLAARITGAPRNDLYRKALERGGIASGK
jgi:16S rRNA (cytidine1402-2'-O)-methyltransferase